MKKIVSTIALFAAASAFGCSDGVPGLPVDVPTDILPDNPICKLECRTLASAGASISGITSVDAFFGAALNFEGQANALQADVKAELGTMAGILGVNVGADASIGDISAAITSNINAGFGGKIDGNVSLDYQPPVCMVSAQATIEASAKCDVDATAGMATVECKGECVAEADVMAKCDANVELKCKGTAPSFDCEGSCQGSCELNADAKCEGECTGSCEVAAEADCDGEFTASTGSGASGGGTCKLNGGAKCEGTCNGSCELNAGATCDGECKGECTYTAPEAGCEGGAKASCEASGSASVMCEGECNGEVTPPMVKAECEATAKAEADFSAECTPPSIGLSYSLTAEATAEFEGDVDARLAFEAQISAFAESYGRLLAKAKKVELVLSAGTNLGTAAGGAVTGAAQAVVAGNGSASGIFNATCAISALGEVSGTINSGVTSLQASGKAVTDISTAVGS